jgi:catechol 2,3-dioxygenase-like lactoylglutathione lyase family enzyme
MLAERRVHVTIPAADLDRARAFYEGALGFSPYDTQPGTIMYQAGSGTLFAVTRSTGTASGTHTQMGFTSPDIEADVADLKGRGVVFEEYDYPTLKTVDGIAQTGPNRAAWFKDSEGNLIGIIQFAEPN